MTLKEQIEIANRYSDAVLLADGKQVDAIFEIMLNKYKEMALDDDGLKESILSNIGDMEIIKQIHNRYEMPQDEQDCGTAADLEGVLWHLYMMGYIIRRDSQSLELLASHTLSEIESIAEGQIRTNKRGEWELDKNIWKYIEQDQQVIEFKTKIFSIVQSVV